MKATNSKEVDEMRSAEIKKVRCPSCDGQIDHLKEWIRGWRRVDFVVFTDGYIDEEEFGEYRGCNERKWECPICNRVLFTNEEEAVKFLKGE